MSTEIKIVNDGSFDIAVGRSRMETAWKNKEWQWSDLVKRVSTTHRTAETYAEYMNSKKPRQDEIKDIGGFCGGYLNGGRKKATNVLHRQLITLDIDFGAPNVWDDFTMLYGNAAVMYSTHKHTSVNPRMRLIMPLDRPVLPDEYEPIARRIAGSIGIEYFDHTTFEPSRLMYWPSTSKDGEFLFDYQDGPWWNADNLLASYTNWKDCSEWPTSIRENATAQRAIKKQGDPLEKPGVIGAFCRCYSIAEVIEKYLSDVYEPCSIEDRYTYSEGSTAGGLVVYEDKYAYSHHGTDPTSQKLCNAFDLVRIHKFGLKDEDAAEGTPIVKMPSFVAMQDFAAADPMVRKKLSIERLEGAKDDFKDIDIEKLESDEPENVDWYGELEVDRKGIPISSINNIYVVLKNDRLLKEALFYDEFDARLKISRNMPWRKVNDLSRDFSDLDFDCLAHYLEKAYKMPFTQLQKGLSKIMTDYQIHPIRNYLNALRWDGDERLETLFIEYLGAEDCPYTRSVTRKTFIAAVARIFEPGTKFDTVLTIVGKEGIGKSTIIAKMAKEWFSDCLGDIHKKEGLESVRGVWIMEIAELASFSKADQETIKRFITSREDMYRPAYGKQNIRFPRQCLFFGTTNKSDFITGPGEHRRFLPLDTLIQLPTKNVFKDLTSGEIDQLWAEALTYYRQGESIDLEAETKLLASKVREAHTTHDERAGLIEKYLDTLFPDNWDELGIYERRAYLQGDPLQAEGTVTKNATCVAELWCEVLGGQHKDMTSQNTKYIHDILRDLKGWQPITGIRKFGVYGRQRGYIRQVSVNTVGNLSTNIKSAVIKNVKLR